MPVMDYQGSSTSISSIGRSILSIRREQVHSVDYADEQELEAFQKHVADIFHALAAAEGDEILSLPWIRKLLDSFLICLEEFRLVLFNSRLSVCRPPLDRFISDFYDRGVKALDICNAVRDGVQRIRQWSTHLEVLLVALNPAHGALGEGQLRRAKKALAVLSVAMLDDKDGGGGNRSSSGRDNHRSHSNFRSHSWSVSRTWSAAKQLQAINSNLNAPRGNEISTTNGLAVPVFTMNIVLLFVMWALVAAIPCQDRGLQTHLLIPRSFIWAAPILSLYERILEESKKKDRKNSCGLLKEIHQIEKLASNLGEAVHIPLPQVREEEVKQGVQELAQICEFMKDELDPLERQVREVFQRIVQSRTEGLRTLGKAHRSQ